MAGTRALSPVTSLIVTVIVLALLGVVAYGIMGGFTPASKPTCWPPTALECAGFSNLNDVGVIVPFQSVQQGSIVPVTVSLPSGETATSFIYNWGDGSKANTSASPTAVHIYNTPGIYLVSVDAVVNGVTHTSDHALVRLAVQPSFTANVNASLPTIAGSVVANSSSVAGGPTPTTVIGSGSTVTLGASYTASPSNPLWREVPPKIMLPATGATVQQNSSSAVNATDKILFNAPGEYQVSFVGGSVNATDVSAITPAIYANFTWTVFVPAAGTRAAVIGNSVPLDPHPGTIISYEFVPGGARTEDPAIAYDTASAEPIENVYQTLIAYNGSQATPNPNGFVPVIATCVPGSQECQSLYSSNLTAPYGNGTDYTFVISSTPQFYDPSTGVSWGVYPTDVMFSIARTLGFSTLPCVSCNNGWILAQSLLPHGNETWDTIHGSFNNTPQQVLGSMSINNSTECPAAALSSEHGCITFHVDGGGKTLNTGHSWPYFLELIADPLGGAIVPCGWFSAYNQGAGIPWWTAANSSGAGDHPCQVPGQGGYGVTANQMPAAGWDQWEELGSGEQGKYEGHVQYSMVGSGPYYLEQYDVGVSYELGANPSYAQNPDCTWSTCYPAAGTYAKTIQVTWETEATEGEQALASKSADFASVPSTDLSLLLQLISEGVVNAIQAPTLVVGFESFDMNFNLAAADKLSTNPVTVPSDFFSYLGMRNFVTRSYPYTTIEDTINTKYGIQLSFDEGGAIPDYMGDYYPTNISWPDANTCASDTNPTCAPYWWAQMHNASSPYFDPEVLACSASSPCELPLIGTTGNPTGDIVDQIWVNEINTLTGGAFLMNPTDVNFDQVVQYSTDAGPGQSALPMYGLGWAPDYPDPTDYVGPMYLANSTYTYGDAVEEALETPAFTSGCPQPYTNYTYFADTAFAQDCQGVAYKALGYALGLAQYMPSGPERVLTYNFAEKIANQLALYVYTGQSNFFGAAAAWININSQNLNPMLGAGGETPYFEYTGNGVAGTGSS
jgi:peptide/nickel transport system substrate-binding protein